MFMFLFGIAVGCFLGVTFKVQVLFVRDLLVKQLKRLKAYLKFQAPPKE